MTTARDTRVRRLRELPALRGLERRDCERIADLMRVESFRRGDVVFREGDPGTCVYIVDAGMLEARVEGRVLSHMGPGEWFGEMALLTGAPRSATVEVVLDCRLYVLDADAFNQLVALHPGVYERLAALLSERLARVSRAGAPVRSEIVVVENVGGWPGRRAVVEALAAAVEQELGEPVAIVSVVRDPTSAAPRPGRRDALVAAPQRGPEAMRRKLVAQLTALVDVPVVLVDVEDDRVAARVVAELAGIVVVLAEPATSVPPAAAPPPRRIALYDRRRGATPPVSDARCAVLPDDDARRAWALGHVARIVTRRTVGIALGSGVAYGLAHLGVLAALEAAAIPIDFVAGASMGSIVGAGYALGVPAAELCATAERLAGLRSARAVLQSITLLARDANLMRPGILGGDRLVRFLESVAPVPNARFNDLVIPYRAVATDLATGARVELADGSLADAMRASASAPWLLSPWRVGERVLIDGGMCDPVPASTVRAMGADLVIAVNVVPKLDPRAQNPFTRVLGALDWLNPLSYLEGQARLPNSFDVVMKSLLILQHELGNRRVGDADVAIDPALGALWFLEFWSAPAFIRCGVEAAEAAIPAIRAQRDRGKPGAPPRTAAAGRVT